MHPALFRPRQALITALGLGATLIAAAGCGPNNPSDLTPAPATDSFHTSDPALAMTLQADIETTAHYVATLPTEPTGTAAPLPTYEVNGAGTPPAMRRGVCPVPDGYQLHERDGFCIAAPEEWAALNVDGGAALTLHTTPDRVITLRPDWAGSTAVCQLTIYIAIESSARDHLEIRRAEFAERTDLQSVSPVVMQSLGGLLLPGFTWESTSGAAGGIFADMVDTNRLLHISLGGDECPMEQVIPVVETLRLNDVQRNL
jgi:hypothetical protein